MTQARDVRPSPIAGQWYPGNREQLAASVDRYLAAAQRSSLAGEVVAVIAPHAGHVYSGPVAGHAFATVKGMAPDLAAVVAPMHHPMPYPLLTTAHSAYQTPLGELPVAHDLIQALDEELQAQLSYGLTPVRLDPEHALEIELPFLQRALSGDFHLLPLMVREIAPHPLRILGQSLGALLKDKKALLVASTDLSHFYSQPAANRLDQEMLRRIEAFDPEAVLLAESEGVGFACGRAAVAVVLWAARALGADTVRVLNYATSGDITGDTSRVVGYGAAVVTRQGLS